MRIEKVANGMVRLIPEWPAGRGIRLTMVQTDIDGDVDNRTWEWTAPKDMDLKEAAEAIRDALDALPFWRAHYGDFELTVGAAARTNPYTVEVEII